MKISVVYSNPLGNTKQLADRVAQVIGRENLYYFGQPCDDVLKSDRIYIGFWTNQGTSDEMSSEFMRKLNDKEVFLFGSAGFGSGDYFNKILGNVRENLNANNKVIGEFMCQGKMKMSVRQRYVSMKDNGVAPPNIDKLIENFDNALTHPDDDDFSNLENAIKNTL